MSTIRFDAPAHPAPRHSDTILDFAAALRDHPGEWALFGTVETPGYARQRAYEIRHSLQGGKTPLFAPAGAYEAQTHSMFGEHRVYARYVGEAR